jgi:hypothetical protein
MASSSGIDALVDNAGRRISCDAMQKETCISAGRRVQPNKQCMRNARPL